MAVYSSDELKKQYDETPKEDKKKREQTFRDYQKRLSEEKSGNAELSDYELKEQYSKTTDEKERKRLQDIYAKRSSGASLGDIAKGAGKGAAAGALFGSGAGLPIGAIAGGIGAAVNGKSDKAKKELEGYELSKKEAEADKDLLDQAFAQAPAGIRDRTVDMFKGLDKGFDSQTIDVYDEQEAEWVKNMGGVPNLVEKPEDALASIPDAEKKAVVDREVAKSKEEGNGILDGLVNAGKLLLKGLGYVAGTASEGLGQYAGLENGSGFYEFLDRKDAEELQRELQQKQIASAESESAKDRAARERMMREQLSAQIASSIAMNDANNEKRVGDYANVIPVSEKQRSDAETAISTFESLAYTLNEMADMALDPNSNIQAWFGNPNNPDMNRYEQLRTDALLQMKGIYELGVLNGKDLELMEKMIQTPGNIFSAFGFEKNRVKLAESLNNAQKDARQRLDIKLKNLGYAYSPTRGQTVRLVVENKGVKSYVTVPYQYVDQFVNEGISRGAKIEVYQ